jgi:hypothetical protein
MFGPFEGTDELRTAPLRHTNVYTVYVGGKPDEVEGTALTFDSPPSPQYPGNQANGYVDPSCA